MVVDAERPGASTASTNTLPDMRKGISQPVSHYEVTSLKDGL